MSAFDRRREPARSRPETSSEAAASVLPVASRLRLQVLNHVRSCGGHGATDDEGESALGLKPQTYTPRRGELVALGLVIDSGARRRTASGRRAVVWCAVTGEPSQVSVAPLVPFTVAAEAFR